MMNLRRAGVCVCALAATAFVSGSALAGPEHYWATGNDGLNLIRIDKTDGSTTTFAAHGNDRAFGTAFAPDGTLYTAYNWSTGNMLLGTFNTVTGAITAVGGSGLGTQMIGLEFDGAGNMYGVGLYDNRFYKINTGAGTSTFIGNTGGIGLLDLAFDNSGTLWGVDWNNRLYTVNTGTGAATFVIGITGAVSSDWGIAFDALGTLYMTTYTQPGQFYSVNTGSGVATLIGSTGVNYTIGGDFEPVVIPLPSTVLMAVAGLGGVLLVRRKFC